MPQAVRVRLVPNRLSEAHHPDWAHQPRKSRPRISTCLFDSPTRRAPTTTPSVDFHSSPSPCTPISFRGYKVASKNGWCHRSRCGSKSLLVVLCGIHQPASQEARKSRSQFSGTMERGIKTRWTRLEFGD